MIRNKQSVAVQVRYVMPAIAQSYARQPLQELMQSSDLELISDGKKSRLVTAKPIQTLRQAQPPTSRGELEHRRQIDQLTQIQRQMVKDENKPMHQKIVNELAAQ